MPPKFKCSVPGCVTQVKKNPSITLHRFPRKNRRKISLQSEQDETSFKINRYVAWLWLIQSERGLQEKPCFVCSRHFVSSDFEFGIAGKKILKGSAVPTRNLPLQRTKHMLRKIVRKKSGLQPNNVTMMEHEECGLPVKNENEPVSDLTKKMKEIVCSVDGCASAYEEDPLLQFYKFPARDSSESSRLCDAWIFRTKVFPVTPSSYICSEHFTQEDFDMETGKAMNALCLKRTAVPSLLLPTSYSMDAEAVIKIERIDDGKIEFGEEKLKQQSSCNETEACVNSADVTLDDEVNLVVKVDDNFIPDEHYDLCNPLFCVENEDGGVSKFMAGRTKRRKYRKKQKILQVPPPKLIVNGKRRRKPKLFDDYVYYDKDNMTAAEPVEGTSSEDDIAENGKEWWSSVLEKDAKKRIPACPPCPRRFKPISYKRGQGQRQEGSQELSEEKKVIPTRKSVRNRALPWKLLENSDERLVVELLRELGSETEEKTTDVEEKSTSGKPCPKRFKRNKKKSTDVEVKSPSKPCPKRFKPREPPEEIVAKNDEDGLEPALNRTAAEEDFEAGSPQKVEPVEAVSPQKANPVESVSPQKVNPVEALSPQKVSPAEAASPQKINPAEAVSPQKVSPGVAVSLQKFKPVPGEYEPGREEKSEPVQKSPTKTSESVKCVACPKHFLSKKFRTLHAKKRSLVSLPHDSHLAACRACQAKLTAVRREANDDDQTWQLLYINSENYKHVEAPQECPHCYLLCSSTVNLVQVHLESHLIRGKKARKIKKQHRKSAPPIKFGAKQPIWFEVNEEDFHSVTWS